MSEPAWVALGSRGGIVDWEGGWSAGVAYVPGDVVRHNGVDYIAVNPSTGQTPPTSVVRGGGYGTSLPASPVDGEEYTLVDSLTNPSYQWRFRYNAGSSSPYKWEFVGGAPLIVEAAATVNTASAAYVDLGGPSLALPVAGDWEIALGAQGSHSATGDSAMSYQIGATAAVDADAAYWRSAAGVGNSNVYQSRKNGLTAVTLAARYKSSAATGYFTKRWMSALPVRVA